MDYAGKKLNVNKFKHNMLPNDEQILRFTKLKFGFNFNMFNLKLPIQIEYLNIIFNHCNHLILIRLFK